MCKGAEHFEFVSYVLEHGLAVAVPEQRPPPYDLANYASCRDPIMGPIADGVLCEEMRTGVLARPGEWFLREQAKWWHSVGVLPKAPGKVRVIHDFSSPSGSSLNDRIDYVKLSYDKVDAAFRAMRPGCWLAKIDITAFFRHIPLDPADWGLTCFRWDGLGKVVDTRVNFGQRNAPEVAFRFSTAIMWAVRRRLGELGLQGWVEVFVVCDDWLVVAEHEDDCRRAWEMIIGVLEQLGFAVNREPHKCIAPCRALVWLGLRLDSVAMSVSLPADKVTKALQLAGEVQRADKVTRQQLDRLFGYLSFCSTVVFGGRAFLHGLRRLRFRPDGGVRGASHRIHVSAALRLDMAWWLTHLERLNGDRRIPIVAMGVEHQVTNVFIDARGGPGGVGLFVDGGFVGLTGEECNARYPAWMRDGRAAALASPGLRRQLDTGAWAEPSEWANHWELFAFCVLLDLFPDVFRDKFVVVRSDSMAACRCVRDLSAALDSPVLAHLTRVFLGLCVRFNVRILPLHIAGVENALADPLSRDRLSEFAGVAGAWVAARGSPSPFLGGLALL